MYYTTKYYKSCRIGFNVRILGNHQHRRQRIVKSPETKEFALRYKEGEGEGRLLMVSVFVFKGVTGYRPSG